MKVATIPKDPETQSQPPRGEGSQAFKKSLRFGGGDNK